MDKALHDVMTCILNSYLELIEQHEYDGGVAMPTERSLHRWGVRINENKNGRRV